MVVLLKDGFEKLEVVKWIVESALKINKTNKAGRKMGCLSHETLFQTQPVDTRDYVH